MVQLPGQVEGKDESSEEEILSLENPPSSVSSEVVDALEISQSVYDDIADRLGETVHTIYCDLISPCVPQQQFMILLLVNNWVIIANHVLNITHKIMFDLFFDTELDIAEWL